ncbi:MAG: hypothetical protein HND53_09895 [Proteobacteria bacterium]|nr:hypothetical protein [Pseudomonadota bacterium]NOG60800.1 hypothetical protein [Pseudomonadota bacterium]
MKAMVGLVLAILIIFGFRLFWPSSESEKSNMTQNEILKQDVDKQTEISEIADNETESSSTELNIPSDEEKTKLMTAEFEILEQARKNLKRHIARLKHEMWGLKFPPDIAKKLSKTVLSANKLLKNPHMLGAFSNVQQIKDELAKVEFAEKSLEEIDEIVKTKLAENNDSDSQINSATQ